MSARVRPTTSLTVGWRQYPSEAMFACRQGLFGTEKVEVFPHLIPASQRCGRKVKAPASANELDKDLHLTDRITDRLKTEKNRSNAKWKAALKV